MIKKKKKAPKKGTVEYYDTSLSLSLSLPFLDCVVFRGEGESIIKRNDDDDDNREKEEGKEDADFETGVVVCVESSGRIHGREWCRRGEGKCKRKGGNIETQQTRGDEETLGKKRKRDGRRR